MEKGIINQSLLEKNIEKIVFFSEEEKKNLDQVEIALNNACKSYKSSNTDLFFGNIRNLKANINSIYEKRERYTIILKAMIERYNKLSDETRQMFSKEV